MSELLLTLLILECVLILSWGLKERSRIIQYPFLVAAVFLGWMVPQLLGLTRNPHLLPDGALSKTIFMAILCLGAVYLGYTAYPRPAKLFWWRFYERRLLTASIALSLAGAFFFFQVSRLAAEVTAATGGQWSGIITIYVFFAQLLTIGFVIALLLHLQRPRWQTLLVIGFGLAFYLHRIVVAGRRAAMVELVLILLLALFFQRRWLPPRWLIIIGLALGALWVHSIGDYRATMLGQDRTTWSGAGLQQVLEIDYLGNLQRLTEGGQGVSELRNAAMNIEATDQLFVFDYWLSLWNHLVRSYVPGQLVGYELKQSLMFDLANTAEAHFDYQRPTGTTSTGLSDAFQSFWYLGAIKFFLAGIIMGRWYRAGVQRNIAAQVILMLVINESLKMVTHGTGGFYAGFVVLVVFLLPVLLFARVRSSRLPTFDVGRNQWRGRLVPFN